MAKIKPFKAYRPNIDKAAMVASRPYDVLNTEEARIEAKDNPYSFLHVVKPEINFPKGHDPYAEEIYKKGKENFEIFKEHGIFEQDDKECFYLYELTMSGRTQTGIVACASIDDYFNNVIKKHELTRPDKEEDRMQHIRVSKINAEPVFFTYKSNERIKEISADLKKNKPLYDFVAVDQVKHRVWKIDDDGTIGEIISIFGQIGSIYVADGHHRTAAAALVGKELREKNKNVITGEEPYNYFMAVHFPDDELKIIDYNRVVKDLNGLSKDEFIDLLKRDFTVETTQGGKVVPAKPHEFGMYLDGQWYRLIAHENTYNDSDPIDGLDVTVLTKFVLNPILGIKDLRRDKRIDFVGGIRGLGELEKIVGSGEMKIAFALYPVQIQQLVKVSDNQMIMPPKTTWFEPKLRSGLFVYSLEL